MQTFRLSNEEQLKTGFTHLVRFELADLQAAITGSPTSVAIAIFPSSGTFPAGTAVLRAGLANPGAAGDWASAVATAFTVSIGDGGDAARLLPATDILSTGTPLSHVVVSHNTGTIPYAYNAADTVDITFSITDDTLDNVTCPDGNPLWFYLQVVDLDAVAN